MHSTNRNAAAEARGVPETDQLGGEVNRENSLTSRPVQGRRGGRRSRAKGDRIEREIVSRHADSSPRQPVPRSYPVLKPAASQFAYGAIPPSLVPNLQAQAKLIKDMIAKTTAGLIEVGRNLIAVKQQLDHGQFMDWVEIEVGYPLSGASHFRGSGHDVEIYVFGPGEGPLVAEVKSRRSGAGFATLEKWVGEYDCLFLRRDGAEAVVLLPWRVCAALLARVRQ